jgi:hypothetical protein
MKKDLVTDPSHERYVVEVDGLAKSEYQIFVEALKASLELKQAFPNSRIKLRDCTVMRKCDCVHINGTHWL